MPMQELKRRAAFTSIAGTVLLAACGAANGVTEMPVAARSTQLTSRSQFQFVNENCSGDPIEDAAPRFDEGAARKVLRARHTRAAACAGGEAPVTVDLIWGPSGCVRVVEVRGPFEPRVAACVLDEFRYAALPRFNGSAVQARSVSNGDDEFSRIGTLATEVIQRVVRSKYALFRECYEQGLGRNQNLRGRVIVRFVILESGKVSRVENKGSDLPDAEVVNCVMRKFIEISFPQPTGGDVTVVYPIMLAPG
jgi:hypothetical protein